MLVVVEDRDLHRFPQSLFDVEAVGSADILEIDAANCGLEQLTELDYLVGILGAYFEVENVEVGELLEEVALAFHHRLAGKRSNVAESEDGGSVGDDGDEVAFRCVLVSVFRVRLDLEAGQRYSRRVGEGEIALVVERLGWDYRDLSGATTGVVLEGVFTLHGTWKVATRASRVLPFCPRQGTLVEMKSASAAHLRPAWRVVFAAMLALVGQLGIFCASLTLAREESSAIAHTEQSGTALHHGHNEATCVACLTLSLQPIANSAAPTSSNIISISVVSTLEAQLLTDPQLLANSCRAPPREV